MILDQVNSRYADDNMRKIILRHDTLHIEVEHSYGISKLMYTEASLGVV